MSSKTVHEVARGMGWFSIALGMTELLGGRTLSRYLGTSDSVAMVRSFGVREILSGVGILFSPKPAAGWLWARVAGDILDLAALEAARKTRGTNKHNLELSLAAVLGATAVDLWCAWKLSQEERSTSRLQKAPAAAVVAKPLDVPAPVSA